MGKDITVQGDVGAMGLFLAFPIDQSAKYFPTSQLTHTYFQMDRSSFHTSLAGISDDRSGRHRIVS